MLFEGQINITLNNLHFVRTLARRQEPVLFLPPF